MPWNLDSDRPIYLQLMERIQHDIISGTYKPGDKLPSVRELAMEASVNPNTMQKALSGSHSNSRYDQKKAELQDNHRKIPIPDRYLHFRMPNPHIY